MDLVKYGVRNKTTNELLRFTVSSNNDDMEFCNSYSAEFSENSDHHVYLVDDRKTAEGALKNDADWYNSSTNYPAWSYKMKKNITNYEVVEVYLTF